jgi:hypothetical protein
MLDDSPAALAHAEAYANDGDESWEQWVAEYRRGDALILRLELTLELGEAAGDVVKVARDGFFVENHAHAPRVEQQIAELAGVDLVGLADELAERGYEIDARDLCAMYVHVELDPEVRRRLRAGGAPPVGRATDPA